MSDALDVHVVGLIVALALLIVASLHFKYRADKLVQSLLELNEELLHKLCLRTEGKEQEIYREMRAATQALLEKHR